jgi:hypothetical protein
MAAHIPDQDSPEKQAKPGEEMAEKAQAAYRWWDDLARLNADDPVWLMLAKLSVRVVGILVLLALSPFILLGLLLAFAAVA